MRINSTEKLIIEWKLINKNIYICHVANALSAPNITAGRVVKVAAGKESPYK